MKMKSKMLTLSMFVVAMNAAAIDTDNQILKDCKFSPKHALNKVLDKARFEQTGGYFHLWNYHNTDNQKFTLTYRAEEMYGREWYITAQHSGQCLQTRRDSNGALLTQFDCVSSATHLLDSTQSNDGYYFIRSSFDINYVLDVKHRGTDNGAKIHAWRFHGGESQKWRIWGCRDMDGNLVSPAS
jgi:hypothetical protein